jgi:hypothetical protein
MCTELLPPGGYPTAINKYFIPNKDFFAGIVSIKDSSTQATRNGCGKNQFHLN